MPSTPAVLDAHAMLVRESYLSLDADELLRRMDAAGIAIAVSANGSIEIKVCKM